MSVNSSFSSQDPNHPVAGGYIQPATGTTGALVCITDTAGSAIKSVGTASNVAYMGIAQYRDSAVTVQNSATAAAPAAAATVATITPATAGVYEVSGTVSISGTTVAAADSNNFNLKKGATGILTNIPIAVNGITGAPGAYPFGPVTLVLDGATAVTVNAVGNATASSIYAAQLIARLVG